MPTSSFGSVIHGIGFIHGQNIRFLEGNIPSFAKCTESCSHIYNTMFKPPVLFSAVLKPVLAGIAFTIFFSPANEPSKIEILLNIM